MKTNRTPAEEIQIRQILMNHPTFANVFSDDWTDKILNDLYYRLYGDIPRNFLVNIGGLVGSPTGIFKSSMGLQIAMHLDPLFNLKHRVAFSVNQLLDKIKNYSEYALCNLCFKNFKERYPGTFEIQGLETQISCENCENLADKRVLLTKLIFFLDEQTKSLKRGGLIRLANIVDTARQRQICFITCGVDAYEFNLASYHLKRVQESHDKYLPKKRVRYAVYDDERDIYYGYFKWDIIELSNPRWNAVWTEYSKMKTEFQRVAMSGQIQQVDFEEYAEEIMNNENFRHCFRITSKGKRVLESTLVRNLIFRKYPDMTNQERDLILAQIKLILRGDVNEEEQEII